jgi:hypothetical protein
MHGTRTMRTECAARADVLPPEITLNILDRATCDAGEYGSVAIVCRQWNALSRYTRYHADLNTRGNVSYNARAVRLALLCALRPFMEYRDTTYIYTSCYDRLVFVVSVHGKPIKCICKLNGNCKIIHLNGHERKTPQIFERFVNAVKAAKLHAGLPFYHSKLITTWTFVECVPTKLAYGRIDKFRLASADSRT